MIFISTSAAMAAFLASPTPLSLRIVLSLRSDELSESGRTDLSALAQFIIVEPCDALDVVENKVGFPIATKWIGGSGYGDTDFEPSWEWSEDHGGWFELVFIFTDDGFAHVLFVPDDEDVDAVLLAMCRAHCRPSNERSATDPPPGLNGPTEI